MNIFITMAKRTDEDDVQDTLDYYDREFKKLNDRGLDLHDIPI